MANKNRNNLHNYFATIKKKTDKDGLVIPDAVNVNRAAVLQANKNVAKVLKQGNKRGNYQIRSPDFRFKVAEYASHHGYKQAAKKYECAPSSANDWMKKYNKAIGELGTNFVKPQTTKLCQAANFIQYRSSTNFR